MRYDLVSGVIQRSTRRTRWSRCPCVGGGSLGSWQTVRHKKSAKEMAVRRRVDHVFIVALVPSTHAAVMSSSSASMSRRLLLLDGWGQVATAARIHAHVALSLLSRSWAEVGGR